MNSELIRAEKNNDIYTEGMYKQQVHNIIDYERMMTIEAAIAAQKEEVVDYDIFEALNMTKTIDMNLYNIAHEVSI